MQQRNYWTLMTAVSLSPTLSWMNNYVTNGWTLNTWACCGKGGKNGQKTNQNKMHCLRFFLPFFLSWFLSVSTCSFCLSFRFFCSCFFPSDFYVYFHFGLLYEKKSDRFLWRKLQRDIRTADAIIPDFVGIYFCVCACFRGQYFLPGCRYIFMLRCSTL